MSDIFLSILNISLTASWLILAAVLIRPLLKKAPKWISCALWSLAAIRLICPWSFESMFSLIPSSEPIPHNIAMDRNPEINSGIAALNRVINPIIADGFTPDPAASANPLQILISVLSVLWLAGTAILLMYALISYIKLKKTVGASISIDENIMSCDEVKSPFILGVIKPTIYVPSSMNGAVLDNVIKHEKTHINRGDHLWKMLGFILLAVYWFNPFCWIAYILLCRDIELACDEKVIRDMDDEGKAAYSEALLTCSFPRRKITSCPLAFGEVGVKERVKTILNYKKPAFWIVLIAIIACAVIGVCFMTNPKMNRTQQDIFNSAAIYVCENPGIGGDFSITLNADGTFQYYEGALSSYIGIGKWSYNDNKIILSDEGMTSLNRKFIFDCKDGCLVYNKEESADFTYVHLKDKTKFLPVQNSQDHLHLVSDGMPGPDE